MRIKVFSWFVLFAVLLCRFPAGAAAKPADYTLLVVPDRFSVMQVAFDVVERFPCVLVSYQAKAADQEPVLYAWNGNEWVFISLQDYRQVSFLQKPPSRVILVGDDRTLPPSLSDASAWAPKIDRVGSLTTAPLLNDLGRMLKFNKGDWRWFSARYNLTLHDESEAMRKSSWYDQPGPLHRPPLKKVISDTDKPAEDSIVVPPPAAAEPVAETTAETTPVIRIHEESAVVSEPVPEVNALPVQDEYVAPAPVETEDAVP